MRRETAFAANERRCGIPRGSGARTSSVVPRPARSLSESPRSTAGFSSAAEVVPKAQRVGWWRVVRQPDACEHPVSFMAQDFFASISIAAPPALVWEILTDTAAWPSWDPSCERIEGKIALGATVKAYSKLSPGRAFPVRVTLLDEPRRMVWRGGMPFGLFTGERSFSLLPIESGVEFSLHEIFKGPLLPLIRSSLPDMNEAFHGFCRGLKKRAEDAVASTAPPEQF